MITEYAYAKINLALEVVKKRVDGYHDLNMIMIPIDLHDILTFEESDQTTLNTSIEISDNAILKTISYFKNKYKIDKNVKVTLEKNIPIGAGLGGGSADISATLRGLNQLWSQGLSLKDLEEDANALGSDTLFCLYNKPAYVYSRGDQLRFIEPIEDINIYLLYPNIEISTKDIFKNHKIGHKNRHFNELLETFENKNYQKFFRKTFNDLHKTAISNSILLKKYYKSIKKINKNAYMSGSGSTHFFIEFDKKSDKIVKKLDKFNIKYIKTTPKTR